MTELSKTVRRKVTATTGEPLVVALTPEGIWLRKPRTRTAYLLPYGAAYRIAGRLAGEAQYMERKNKPSSRRIGR